MTQAKREIALVIRVEKSGEYGHVTGYTAKPDSSKGNGFSGFMSYEHPLHGLIIHSQISAKSEALYGWQFAIESYARCDLNDAKNIVALLAPIQRKMDKMHETEGNAASFGAWVNRIARAIGAKKVFVQCDEKSKIATGNSFREYSLCDSVFAVDRITAGLVAWANPQLHAVAA